MRLFGADVCHGVVVMQARAHLCAHAGINVCERAQPTAVLSHLRGVRRPLTCQQVAVEVLRLMERRMLSRPECAVACVCV